MTNHSNRKTPMIPDLIIETPTNLDICLIPDTETFPDSNLLSDHRENEMPPANPYDFFPEDFCEYHSVAYLYLNLLQIGSPNGFNDMEVVLDGLEETFEGVDREEMKDVVLETIRWSQNLPPRGLKSSIVSLIWYLEKVLIEDELTDLMERLGSVSDWLEENFQNRKGREFLQWLDCFFMEETGLGFEPFVAEVVFDEEPYPDPVGWSFVHDVGTMMLYFNHLNGNEFTDADKFQFILYLASSCDDVDFLLEEVRANLITDEIHPDSRRLAQSHRNLLTHYHNENKDQVFWKDLFFRIYKTTEANTGLNMKQKEELKRWFFFWNQFVDLDLMLWVIDYADGTESQIFNQIDYPSEQDEPISLYDFCCS